MISSEEEKKHYEDLAQTAMTERENLKSKLDSVSTSLQQSEKICTKLELQVEELKQSSMAAVKSVEMKYETLRSSVHDSSAKVERNLRDQIASLIDKNKVLQDNYEISKNKASACIETQDYLKSELTRMNTVLKKKEEENDKLTCRLEKVRESSEASMRSMELKQTHLEQSLKSTLQDETVRLEENRIEIQRLKDDLQGLREENIKLREREMHLKESQNSLAERNDELQHSLRLLEKATEDPGDHIVINTGNDNRSRLLSDRVAAAIASRAKEALELRNTCIHNLEGKLSSKEIEVMSLNARVRELLCQVGRTENIIAALSKAIHSKALERKSHESTSSKDILQDFEHAEKLIPMIEEIKKERDKYKNRFIKLQSEMKDINKALTYANQRENQLVRSRGR